VGLGILQSLAFAGDSHVDCQGSQRLHALDLRAVARSMLHLSLGFSCEFVLCFSLLYNFCGLGCWCCAMAKFGAKIQAPLRKFLYGGRVPSVQGSDGLLFSGEQSDVKTEEGWYDFAVVASGASGLEASNEPMASNSTAPSGASSDCVIIETLSTPAKTKAPDLIVLDPAIANAVHEASRKRKTYELNRHFQDSWATKCPWAEPVVGINGRITQVRCKICTDVEGREKLLVPKIDSLMKHARRRRATADMGKIKRGEYFYLGNNQHVKNERVYFAKGGETIVTKVLAGVTRERRLKVMQMCCMFDVLSQGQPMADFIVMRELLLNLMVPNIPKKHWSQPFGWQFANAMAAVCSDHLKRDMQNATFISASADEVTTVDNQQWFSVHVYFAVNFSRESHLLCIRRVDDDSTTQNLTEMITEQLFMHGGVCEKQLAEKLICFRADGAVVFQGARTGMIQRLKEGYAPYVIHVHDFAH
jgi:hypothetical protein